MDVTELLLKAAASMNLRTGKVRSSNEKYIGSGELL